MCNYSLVAVFDAATLICVLWSGGNADDVWAAHCCDKSGLLTQYAAAMHRLATDIWPQNNAETRIEWCYKACMDYFFGGGLAHVRDKATRRQNYQCHRHAGNAEDSAKDDINHSVHSFTNVQHVNAVAEVELTESFSAGSSLAV